MNPKDGTRVMVVIGWILVVLMAWQTGASILEGDPLRAVTGITFLALGLWALGVNRESLGQKSGSTPDPNREDAQTRRG